MYLLYADETNTDPAESRFLIYAGVTATEDAAREINREMRLIRRRNGYLRADQLKFNTRDRPSHIGADAHKAIKKEVLALAARRDVKLYASMVHQKISGDWRDPSNSRRKYPLETVLFQFYKMLRSKSERGLVFVDRYAGVEEHIAELMEKGLNFGSGSTTAISEHIVEIHTTDVNSSPMCSVADIVIGALRYAVNAAHSESLHVKDVGKELLEQLTPLLEVVKGRVTEKCICLRPNFIKSQACARDYTQLIEYFREAGIELWWTPGS